MVRAETPHREGNALNPTMEYRGWAGGHACGQLYAHKAARLPWHGYGECGVGCVLKRNGEVSFFRIDAASIPFRRCFMRIKPPLPYRGAKPLEDVLAQCAIRHSAPVIPPSPRPLCS